VNNLDSELASLSLENDMEGENVVSQAKRSSVLKDDSKWRQKFSLRNHLDAIRSIEFSPNDLTFLTASEDHTIKFWNLEPLTSTKKSPVDIEPVFTYRGHKGSVNCLSLSTLIPSNLDSDLSEKMVNGVFYSAGNDGVIRIWGVPDKNLSPYLKYGIYFFPSY
jgi:striatin 1/3/4